MVIDVSEGESPDTFCQFVNLPNDDEHCLTVDLVKGSWFLCNLCDMKVKNRLGQERTLATWNSHKNESRHSH